MLHKIGIGLGFMAVAVSCVYLLVRFMDQFEVLFAGAVCVGVVLFIAYMLGDIITSR